VSDQSRRDALFLLLLIIISCIGVGVGVAALASYPLYWGLLVGWLCPSVVVVASITVLATCPRYWANRTNRGSRRYWLSGRSRAKIDAQPSSFLDTQDITRDSLTMRPTREESHQLVQHKRKLKNRLQLATTHLEEVERERIWAIVAAHDAGLSIRKIATVTGLSRSHIHQFLQEHEGYFYSSPRKGKINPLL
jgi:hypothetical protein